MNHLKAEGLGYYSRHQHAIGVMGLVAAGLFVGTLIATDIAAAEHVPLVAEHIFPLEALELAGTVLGIGTGMHSMTRRDLDRGWQRTIQIEVLEYQPSEDN